MLYFLIAIILSLLINYYIIKINFLQFRFIFDYHVTDPQKIHREPVPRIGGLSIFLSILFVYGIFNVFFDRLFLIILVSSAIVYSIGFIEDVTKSVPPFYRLLVVSLAALVCGTLSGLWLNKIQIAGFDHFLSYYPFISILLTILAVSGVSNSFNLVDGIDGLSSGLSLLVLISMAYVAVSVNDIAIYYICICITGSIVGFLLFNFPKGLIFLGDGGSYLLGFLIAELSIMITSRNGGISKWYPLLLCFYPIIETSYTIFRRWYKDGIRQVMHPDSLHMHHLILRFLSENYKCTYLKATHLAVLIIWFFASVGTLFATYFYNDAFVLQVGCVIYALLYIYAYRILLSKF